MFDFTNAILLAASVATNVVFGVVLLINHAQQKAHNADILDMESEIDGLTASLEDQREYAREMYLKVSDENARLVDQGDALEDIIGDLLGQRNDFAVAATCYGDLSDELEVSLGQAMAYATDLETVIEAALDTIMEQRETIEKLTIAVIGGDPDVDDVSHIDYFVFTDGTVVVN